MKNTIFKIQWSSALLNLMYILLLLIPLTKTIKATSNNNENDLHGDGNTKKLILGYINNKKKHTITITIDTRPIQDIKDMDAIINQIDFNLNHISPSAQEIKKMAGESYNQACQKCLQYNTNHNFGPNGFRAFIVPSFSLRKMGVNHIINTVPPILKKNQSLTKKPHIDLLQKTYSDSLLLAEEYKIKKIACPLLGIKDHDHRKNIGEDTITSLSCLLDALKKTEHPLQEITIAIPNRELMEFIKNLLIYHY